jgi:peroxiredoxin
LYYWRIVALGCVAAIILALIVPFRPQAAASKPVAWTGGQQPQFTLPSIADGDVALDAEQASVILVHFFATWCEPCREELPALSRLSERGGASLTVIAISVAEPDTRVQRFMQAMPVNFPVLLDADRAVAKSWKVTTLPTTFVLDSQLKPRLVVEADYAWDKVDPNELIDALSVGHGPNPQNPLTQNLEGHNALR